MVNDVVDQLGFLALGSRLKRIGERMQGEVGRYMAECGLDVPPGLQPLLVALDRNGPLTVNELVEALGVSQPGVTRSIGQLEKAGIVETRRHQSDRRSKVVALTEEGRERVEIGKRELWPHVEAAVAEVCAGLEGSFLDQLAGVERNMARMPLDRRAVRLGNKGERDDGQS